MAFFKKVQKKVNGLWYPQSITVGKPVTTDEVSDKLAALSTVTRGDAYAVLKNLGGVLGDFMAAGRTVKLEGVGTFYYTSCARKQGVESEEQVNATLITGVRVRFLPEVGRNVSSQVITRSLVGNNIFWEEWAGKESTGSSGNGDSSDSTGGEDDGNHDNDLGENPLG